MGDKRKQDNRGFSLVEVVVSAAILAIIGSVILGSFSMAVRMNARAKQTYRAANYAQKAMEYLMTDEDVEDAVVSAVEDVCETAGKSWDDVCNAAEDAVNHGYGGYWFDVSQDSEWDSYWSTNSLGITGSSDRVTVNNVTASTSKNTVDDKLNVTIELEVTASADGAGVTLSGKRIITLELTESTPGL